MSNSLPDRLDGVHPQMLAMDGESLRKKVAVGKSIERALAIAGLSQKDAAGQMGYSDQGTVSRWCAGVERPHFDKLFDLDGFEEAWMKARAECNARVTVRTVIEIQEKSA